MTATLFRSIVTFFILLTLAPAFAQIGPATKPAELPGLKLTFPEVKGWERHEPHALPGASGGYSLGYNSKDGTAVTIYVFNRGLAKIADDLNAPEVQEQFTGAKDALKEAKRLGMYEKVEELESGESFLGDKKVGRKALYARFNLQVKKMDVVSEIYVLAYHDYFIKLRITRLADAPEEAEGALDSLKTEIAKMLAK